MHIGYHIFSREQSAQTGDVALHSCLAATRGQVHTLVPRRNLNPVTRDHKLTNLNGGAGRVADGRDPAALPQVKDTR
jgi:hypothetical protein